TPPPLPPAVKAKKTPSAPSIPGRAAVAGVSPAVTAPAPPPSIAGRGTRPLDGSGEDLTRKHFESQIQELQRQLMEEREKLLLQTVRTKEEESLASRVEESIKDIQDKLRREKKEQELQEQLSRDGDQIKELEKRLADERETWMATFRNQLSQRDTDSREIEQTFELRLHDLERKWQDEKNNWSLTLKQKDDELAKLKSHLVMREEELTRVFEKRVGSIESEKRRFEDELDSLRGGITAREKELLSLKAEVALINSSFLQERGKLEKYRAVIEKQKKDNELLIVKSDEKDREYFVFKMKLGALHSKAKAEEERLRKEAEGYREELGRLKQEGQIAQQSHQSRDAETSRAIERLERENRELKSEMAGKLMAKEEELSRVRSEYGKQLYDRETELKDKQREYENQLHSRETELKDKQREYENQLLSWEKQFKDMHADYNEKLRARDVAFNSQQIEYENKIAGMRSGYESAIASVRSEHEKKITDVRSEYHVILKGKESEYAGLVSEYEEKIKGLSSDGQRVKEEAQSARAMHSARETELKQLIEKLEQENKALKLEMGGVQSEYKAELRSREDEINSLRSDHTEMSSALVETKTQLKLLEEMKKHQEQATSARERENEQLKFELSKANGTIREFEEKLKDIDRTVEGRLESTQREFLKRIDYLEQANRQLHGQVIDRDGRLKEMVEEHKSIKDSRRDEIQKIEREFIEYKHQYRETAETVSMKDRQIEGLTHRVDGLQTEISQNRVLFNRQTQELATAIQGKESIIKELNEKLSAERTMFAKEQKTSTDRLMAVELKLTEIERTSAAATERQKNEIGTLIKKKDEETEATIEKLDFTWKEFHSRFLEEYKVLEEKLALKEREIEEIQIKLGNGLPAVEPDELFANIDKGMDVEGFEKKGIAGIVKGLWNWLNKPVVHI
ncbi:MAG: hypothetical protein ABIJ11_05295, partial [Elusimicrobiota bacterium]